MTDESREGLASASGTGPSQAEPEVSALRASVPDADDRCEEYDDHDTDYCGNCGGEGFTYGCSWDWQCDTYDEGEGTCLCTRRCEWCQPPSAAEIAERQKLRDVLATALAKDKVAEMRAAQGIETRSAATKCGLKGESPVATPCAEKEAPNDRNS